MILSLILTSLSFQHVFPFFVNNQIVSSSDSSASRTQPDKVSFEECDMDPEERLDCGFSGITQDQCEARECCWDDAVAAGTPQCYHSNSTVTLECFLTGQDRITCGSDQIWRKEQCLANNCCWQPSNDDSPWCYQSQTTLSETRICGKAGIPPKTMARVIGGEDATPHSWPWMVSLQYGGRHFCGGSLINERWVLSAAHCSERCTPNSPDSLVVLGAYNISDDETTKVKVMMDQVITHEQFRFCFWADNVFGGTENDVLLIRLAEPVTFNDVISPVCLAQEFPAAGKQCYAIGWGMDAFDMVNSDYSVPDLLQQFMAPIIDSELCNSTDWYNGRINPTTMCAGYEEGGRSNCFGDSGGPLMCTEDGLWEQVGIVSWGEECAAARFPGVYAEVSQHNQWIADQMDKFDNENT